MLWRSAAISFSKFIGLPAVIEGVWLRTISVSPVEITESHFMRSFSHQFDPDAASKANELFINTAVVLRPTLKNLSFLEYILQSACRLYIIYKLRNEPATLRRCWVSFTVLSSRRDQEYDFGRASSPACVSATDQPPLSAAADTWPEPGNNHMVGCNYTSYEYHN